MKFDTTYKSGFISIIGRTNVGKSTFLNQVLGRKIAITSSKPQTTRNTILGILTTTDYQLVFTDTPGIHKPEHELDKRMVNASYSSTKGVDAVIFMTTPLKEVLRGDEIILEGIKDLKIPVYLVINKIDLLKTKAQIDECIVLYQNLYPWAGIFPISALNNLNTAHLVHELVSKMEYGPKYYPEEMLSSHPERFIIAEFIREKILLFTKEEVPHSIAVVIESMKRNEENTNYMDIYATIYVERDSQKKIIIGRNGELIKQIKEKSIMDIKHFLNSKVHLDLWIKVKKNWRNSPKDLNSLGYGEDNF